MKSLVLKDIYGAMSHAKTFFFICAFFLVTFFPSAGSSGYIVIVIFVISLQVIGITFLEDEKAKWSKYAMVTPITRKELVRSKFILLFVFMLIGALIGTIVGMVAGVVVGKIDFSNTEELMMVVSGVAGGCLLALWSGSLTILITFKFGSEKSHILNVAVLMVPFGISFFIFDKLVKSGIGITEIQLFLDNKMPLVVALVAVFMLLWVTIIYQISCRVVEKQELV